MTKPRHEPFEEDVTLVVVELGPQFADSAAFNRKFPEF